MRAFVGTEPVTLDDAALLGTGGEARVYRHRDRALKIYHEIDPALPAMEAAIRAKERDRKIAKLIAFPKDLPSEVVAPEELVFAADRRTPIGFAMPIAQGTEVMKLHLPAGKGLATPATIVELFLHLHDVLRVLHAKGLVVGDLNDGNVLFEGARPWLIDADSMQLPGHPCTVAHERFLDPRLYGVDLAHAPAFDASTDWYAFAVMLFGSLLRVHPYGGTHARLGTLLRRAEAAHSVLRADVKRPKSAEDPQILPDALLDRFERIFDGGLRGELPRDLLHLRFSSCPACGLEHARPTCPRCAARGVVVARPAIRHHGRCRATIIHRTEGRILAARMRRRLEWVVEERGVVCREDGARVMEEPAAPGTRFVPAGPTTWIGRDRRLVAVTHEKVTALGATSTFSGEPCFDATSLAVWRTDAGWLLQNEVSAQADSCPPRARTLDLASALRLGTVVDGQTWIRASERLGFGFYRAGRATMYFLFRPGRPGLVDVRLPPIVGRLVDVSAAFDDEALYFGFAVEHQGQARVHLAVIGADGVVRGRLEGAPDEHRALASVRGKCLNGGVLVAATDEGLLSMEVDRASGRLVERTLFADTEPFVELGAELLPGPGGSIYVITEREITELALA